MKIELKELAAILFAEHPETDLFYIVSDGQAFTEEHRADGHAQRLKDGKVTPVTREGYEGSEDLTLKSSVLPATDETNPDEDNSADDKTEDEKEAERLASEKLAAEKIAAEGNATNELEVLRANYATLFGKKPSHFAGIAKLKADIEAKEKEGA